jgi:dolichyl-phosphate-mannose-protein mannosyltransferase
MPVLILFLLSAFTHLLFFGWPQEVVFDEVHNGRYVSAYSHAQYYFDVHPPLGKLLTKFFADFVHAPSTIDWTAIGNILPWSVIELRLLPLILGIFLPLIIYYICRNLSFSKAASFAAGMLIVLENSLLVQSRFILFDIIMITFGFLALLLYLIYIRKGMKWLIYASALAASVAFSIKWTGFAFPLVICVTEIIRLKKVSKICGFIFRYVVVGIAAYILVFAVHFAYLTHTGTGDVFMTDRFQSTLIGNPLYGSTTLKPKGFFGKFFELNVEIYDANKTLTATHPYSSSWWSWPLMLRPIFYWQGRETAGGNEYIYLIGNPLIYWLGSAAVLFLISEIIRKKGKDKKALFLVGGYLVNFLPFIFIGRVMFLYHYEAALVFSVLCIAYCLEAYVPRSKKVMATSILLGVTLCLFVFFAPLTYGLKLSDSALHARMWIGSWR